LEAGSRGVVSKKNKKKKETINKSRIFDTGFRPDCLGAEGDFVVTMSPERKY